MMIAHTCEAAQRNIYLKKKKKTQATCYSGCCCWSFWSFDPALRQRIHCSTSAGLSTSFLHLFLSFFILSSFLLIIIFSSSSVRVRVAVCRLRSRTRSHVAHMKNTWLSRTLSLPVGLAILRDIMHLSVFFFFFSSYFFSGGSMTLCNHHHLPPPPTETVLFFHPSSWHSNWSKSTKWNPSSSSLFRLASLTASSSVSTSELMFVVVGSSAIELSRLAPLAFFMAPLSLRGLLAPAAATAAPSRSTRA